MEDQDLDKQGQTHEASSPQQSIYAAGFNAHSQLQPDSTDDQRTFQAIPDQDHAKILFAGWSTTVLTTSDSIISLGNAPFSHAIDRDPETGSPTGLRSAMGDHNGILACLDDGGDLYLQLQPSEGLVCVTSDTSPALSHVARTSTGRVAVTFRQAPNGRLCHVNEFRDLETFLAWYQDPSGVGTYPQKHHMLPGRPRQMIANTATFLLLMESGEVYSWGDPRMQSLGRPIHGEGASSAGEPRSVTALGGLKIVKVASGGWLSAALSDAGALYVWGAAAPGSQHSMKCLREEESGEVVLVEITRDGSDEPLDIDNVDAGDHHMAVVTTDHRLFVVGNNSSGQLGLGSEETFLENWTEVCSLPNVLVRDVFCGPLSTFTLT